MKLGLVRVAARVTKPVAAIALAFTLQAPAALADDGCCGPLDEAAPAGPTLQIDDDDSTDAQVIRDLEARLNEVLIVEESGRIVLREEFRDALPVPAGQVQMFLGSLVELGPDGKIRIKNPEIVRPYLPQIQRFLSPEAMEKLRELQKLPPEQRREAMQRLMNRGAQPAPQAKPEPRPAPRGDDEGWDEGDDDEEEAPRHARPHADGRRHTAPPARDGSAPRGSADDRLARLEHRLERLERALREGQGHHPDQPRAERRPRPLDLFGRDRAEGAPRRDMFGDLGRRAEVWRGGLGKLGQIMKPDDFQRLGRTMDRLRGQLQAGDLRDRGQLMEKLQEAVDPADIGRFMEIFSEFIASPEGREFVAELERMVERLEAVVNSEQGKRLGETLERFGQGDMRERMDQLMRGRDARPREEERREQPRRPGGPRVPEGAKLY